MGGSKPWILSRRLALIGAACLATGCITGVAASAPPTKVLFVCEAGSVKSAIAREQLRRMAKTRGLSVEVSSRGLAPADHISPALADALAADGLDVRTEPVRALVSPDLADADMIVVFNALPSRFGTWSTRDWSDVPSMNADYPAARVALLEKLDGLIAELETRKRSRPN